MKKVHLYLADFNIRNFLKVLALVITLFLLRKFLYKGINKFIISPFGIDYIKSDINLDLLSILIFIACLIWIIYLTCWRKLVPCINSLINIILISLCYLLVIRFSGNYTLEPMQLFSSIKYIDILFFWLLLIISNFKYYKSNDSSKLAYSFVEDSFNPETTRDILGRRNYAHQIALKILRTNSLTKAFVIAINSPWGFGKSGFLLLMEQFFKEKNIKEFSMNTIRCSNLVDGSDISNLFVRRNNAIIVRYNPWKNFDDKKIVQDFFDELSVALSKYDSQLSKKVKSYGKYLYKLDDSKFSKVVELAVESMSNEPTLTKIFDEINNSIERIQKRIIVFVDDLDRLTGDELIDILKLIRNTANFRNTFFVIAYDHNYVLNTIEKKDLISNKEEYLHKIVQLDVTLPIFQKNVLIQFLEDQLKEYTPLSTRFYKIQLALNEILAITVLIPPTPGSNQANTNNLSDFFFRSQGTDDSLLFNVFQNIRDVVRFVNSYKLSFEAIGEFTDVYEIILLEILKVKYLSVYQLVSTKRFLNVVDQKYEFDFDGYDGFLTDEIAEALNIRQSEKHVIKIILESVFSPKRKSYFRSVKYPRYFDIYFTYQAPSLLQLEMIEAALKAKDINQIIEVIDTSFKEGTFDDLRNFLDSQTDFTSKDDFEIILKSLFYIARYDDKTKLETIFQIKTILRDISIAENFYTENKDEYSAFLLSLLNDTKYDLKARSEIAGDELYKIINKDDSDSIFVLRGHKVELQNILLKCLKEKMAESNEFDMELFNFYLKNLKEIESGNRHIIITEEANEAMREFILAHSYDYFKKYLLREHPEPSFKGQYFQLDPFILHYFNNDSNLVKSTLKAPAMQGWFEKEKDGKEFFDLLVRIVDTKIGNKEERFLITDKKEIELAERFIAIVIRRKNNSRN